MSRPWKVFVRDIGPTKSYGSRGRAMAEADSLALQYAEVLVYTVEPGSPHERWVFTGTYNERGQGIDVKVTYERLVDGQWVPDPKANLVAQEGCDRCFCGCKYWEADRCIDCGTHVTQVPMSTSRGHREPEMGPNDAGLGEEAPEVVHRDRARARGVGGEWLHQPEPCRQCVQQLQPMCEPVRPRHPTR